MQSVILTPVPLLLLLLLRLQIPVSPTRPSRIKVPTIDGNPLQWEKFEAEFSTAIKTRALHYSNFDIKCLLTGFVVPDNAKNTIRHHPGRDAPLVDLLKALREEYGTPHRGSDPYQQAF